MPAYAARTCTHRTSRHVDMHTALSSPHLLTEAVCCRLPFTQAEVELRDTSCINGPVQGIVRLGLRDTAAGAH